MNVTELIERLRKWHNDTGAPSYRDAADALEAQARKIADCNRLRDDERLTWDAQHKRQASMNAHLAELVTDAQEELRKCQQDAIALQDRLAEADANAPWLTQAHMICTDHGIPQGNISDRLEMLVGYLAEAERDAERYRYLRDATGWSIQQWLGLRGVWTEYLSGKNLDDAIDAAMDGK